MKSAKTTASVIWAVTPFDEDRLKSQASAGRAIDAILGAGFRVAPVCVWDTAAIDSLKAISGFKERASLIFSRWQKPKLRANLTNLRIIEAWGGASAQARALAEYAKKAKASLIVANHHRRTGVKKWFQGSFCESLALSSEVPLLIVPPDWKAPTGKARTILFPTDLSAASLAAFEEVLGTAKRTGMGIALYHRAEFPIFVGEEFIYSASKEMILVERQAERESKRKIEEMAKRARSEGVAAKAIYDRRRGGRPADAILAQARRGYALVAMAAHNGLLGRIMLGSTSRAVMRDCTIPMWVVRTTKAEKRKKSTGAPLRKSSKRKAATPRPSEVDTYLT